MSAREYFPRLTVARGVAALWVAAYHWGSLDVGERLPQPHDWVLRHGFIAVPFFFCLSGFVLHQRYASQRSLDLRVYARSRMARLYPVYLLGLALELPFLLLRFFPDGHLGYQRSRMAKTLVTTPLLVQAWFSDVATFWNGPSWSLSNEVWFYAAFPLVLVLARRSPAVLPVLTLSVTATSTACYAADVGLDPSNPVVNLGVFLLGMQVSQLLPLYRRRPGVTVATAVATATAALSMLDSTGPLKFIGGTLLWCAAAALVASLTLRPAVVPVERRGLGHLLGVSSYALYIIHVPVLEAYLYYVLDPFPRFAGWLRLTTFLALACAAAVLVHRRVEVPAQRAVMARGPARRRDSQEADQLATISGG